MKSIVRLGFLFFLIGFAAAACNYDPNKKQSNIVFIMIDDMGFNDLSFRGNNEILTPNMDALFYKGVTLNRYYTSFFCTPSRASLLTGRYSHHIGLHREVSFLGQPWAMGTDQKLMPEYLKEAGYNTHLVGKWHLGMYQPQYTPMRRGFDTHYGFYGSKIDYFNREIQLSPRAFPPGTQLPPRALDHFENTTVDRAELGTYVTDLYTARAIKIIEEENGDKPFFLYFSHLGVHTANEDDLLQYRQEDYDLYSHITWDPLRRKYAAMLKRVDDSVGAVIDALHRTGKLQDTIIALTSDNGGATMYMPVASNRASNHPLRGIKGSAWEGGIRVNAVVYAPWLPSGAIRDHLFHVSDWLPTLSTLANSGVKFDRFLDGIDLSEMITKDSAPYRDDVETLEEINLTTSYISGYWKLANSSYPPMEGLPDTWLGSNENVDHNAVVYNDLVLNSTAAKALAGYSTFLDSNRINQIRPDYQVNCSGIIIECDVLSKPCLFNLQSDPCEQQNLADQHPEIVENLLKTLAERVALIQPSINVGTFDPASDPSLHDGAWVPWQEDSEGASTSQGIYAERFSPPDCNSNSVSYHSKMIKTIFVLLFINLLKKFY